MELLFLKQVKTGTAYAASSFPAGLRLGTPADARDEHNTNVGSEFRIGSHTSFIQIATFIMVVCLCVVAYVFLFINYYISKSGRPVGNGRHPTRSERDGAIVCC